MTCKFENGWGEGLVRTLASGEAGVGEGGRRPFLLHTLPVYVFKFLRRKVNQANKTGCQHRSPCQCSRCFKEGQPQPSDSTSSWATRPPVTCSCSPRIPSALCSFFPHTWLPVTLAPSHGITPGRWGGGLSEASVVLLHLLKTLRGPKRQIRGGLSSILFGSDPHCMSRHGWQGLSSPFGN